MSVEGKLIYCDLCSRGDIASHMIPGLKVPAETSRPSFAQPSSLNGHFYFIVQ